MQPHPPRKPGRLPLEGIRALDCTHFAAGPLALRLLADLGAEVIKVESVQHADPQRMSGPRIGASDTRVAAPSAFDLGLEWTYVNRNKYGLTLDLGSEDGGRLFRSLVKESAIVAENFRPGVWEKFGLSYDVLSSIRPDIILLRMPGYGTTGPWRDRPSWAGTVDQMSGFAYFSGYDGEEPLTHALWQDYANGLHAAFALLVALHHRKRTGRGGFIDLSQIEAVTSLNAELILDYQTSGEVWRPAGNRSRHGLAPHGCFPCLGEDTWIAIAVGSDAEWRGLCAEVGDAGWLHDARFETRAGRFAHQAALHEELGRWTRRHDKWGLMHRLQAAGVPAAAVAHGWELQQDGHFQERGLVEHVDREVVGELTLAGTPFRYNDEALRTRRSAPLFGEHTRMILQQFAGLSDDELDDLAARNVIGNVPRNM